MHQEEVPLQPKGRTLLSDTALGPKGEPQEFCLAHPSPYFLTFLSNVFDLFLACETFCHQRLLSAMQFLEAEISLKLPQTKRTHTQGPPCAVQPLPSTTLPTRG